MRDGPSFSEGIESSSFAEDTSRWFFCVGNSYALFVVPIIYSILNILLFPHFVDVLCDRYEHQTTFQCWHFYLVRAQNIILFKWLGKRWPSRILTLQLARSSCRAASRNGSFIIVPTRFSQIELLIVGFPGVQWTLVR